MLAGAGPHFLAIAASNGQVLFDYTTSGNIHSAASISNGDVYVGNLLGTLYDFGLSSTPTPTPTNSPTQSPSPTLTATGTPGTTIAQDDFHRPNQSLWGTASDGQTWTGDANSLTNFSINNDMGQVTSNTLKAYSGLLGAPAVDAETVFSGTLTNFTGTKLGTVLRWTDNNNWYQAAINGTKLIIQKKVNGTLTSLGQVSFSAAVGTSYMVRFNVVGTTLSAKAWRTGTPEPSNWMLTVSDSSLSSGYCGLLLYLPSGVTATITSFEASMQ